MNAEDELPGLRDRLSLALRIALRQRDTVAVAAVRSALSAIANAEAVATDPAPVARTSSPHFAGATAGLGAAEVARRALSETAIRDIVRAEIADRQLAASQYATAGYADRSARLRGEAAVLLAAISDEAAGPPGTDG